MYDDFAIESLVQSLEKVQEQFENHVFLKAVIEESIVGSVRGQLKEGNCHIGKLIVHPNYQNMGIGKLLMSEIESFFNLCLRYELFTGNISEKNVRLYEKIGYQIFKIEKINANLSMVYLEKHNS